MKKQQKIKEWRLQGGQPCTAISVFDVILLGKKLKQTREDFLQYVSARRSGEDKSIPDTRQRDGRNDWYTERLLTARRGPPARSKIFWDSPLRLSYRDSA